MSTTHDAPLYNIRDKSRALYKFVISFVSRIDSVTNYFLVNLSVADLLVTTICMPMAISQNITVIWFYGLFMCKFGAYLQGKLFSLYYWYFKTKVQSDLD